ncbi:hypothetical protein TNCV_1787781 [Trichonephila clavipes]|nr:hypothetical protein TNCV_1787781 [Trichonephila clavipes]
MKTPREAMGSLVVRASDSRLVGLAHDKTVEVEIDGVAIYSVEFQSGSGNFPTFPFEREQQCTSYTHLKMDTTKVFFI